MTAKERAFPALWALVRRDVKLRLSAGQARVLNERQRQRVSRF